jgi:hypothetical protein
MFEVEKVERHGGVLFCWGYFFARVFFTLWWKSLSRFGGKAMLFPMVISLSGTFTRKSSVRKEAGIASAAECSPAKSHHNKVGTQNFGKRRFIERNVVPDKT